MSIALRVLLIIVSVINTLNILRRIRKSKLQIDYSIFWLVFSMGCVECVDGSCCGVGIVVMGFLE